MKTSTPRFSTSAATRASFNVRTFPVQHRRHPFSSALACGLVALLSAAASLQADTPSWVGSTANTDINWSTGANWTTLTAPNTTSDVVFTGSGAVSGTTPAVVTNVVDTNFTINSLTYSNLGTAAVHDTQIGPGITLTITGSNAALGLSSTAALMLNPNLTGSTSVVMSGGGSLVVSASSTDFSVAGLGNSGGASGAVLDMSGLSNFFANVRNFFVGVGQRNAGIIALANASGTGTNTIIANSVSIGGGNGTTGGPFGSSLTLGKTNILDTDSLTVAGPRESSTFAFSTSSSNSTIVIRGRDGVSRVATLTMANNAASASTAVTGNLDFSLGFVDALFGTMNLGTPATGSGGGNGIANVILSSGTIDALTVNAGNNSSSTGAGTGIANITVNGGSFITGTTTLGRTASATGVSGATGVITQNGGVTQFTSLILANRTTTTTAAIFSGTFNLNGGTLRAQSILPGDNGASTTGTATRAFNWAGGTITNVSGTNLTISGTGANGSTLAITLVSGSTTAPTFSPDSGRTITVNAPIVEAVAGLTLTKSGSGTLILGSTNTYTGATNVNAGTLVVSGSINGAGAVTVANGATLGGSGFIAGAVAVSGTLYPGVATGTPTTLTTGSSVTFSNGSTFQVTIDNTGNGGAGLSGLLSIGGGLTLSGSDNLTLNVLNGSGTNQYTIATFTSRVGTFSNVTPGFTVTYNPTSIVVSQQVPEPATWAMLIGGVGMLMIFRRHRRRSN